VSLDSLIEPSEKAEHLRNVIFSGEAVAFVGSGISMGCYPSWRKTVDILCLRCGIDTPTKDLSPEEFLNKAEECKKLNEQEYFNILRELFGQAASFTRLTYNYLFRLPFKAYVTTNFDPLLAEHRSSDSKVFCYPILNFEEIGKNTKPVFYIHGTVSNYAHNPREIECVPDMKRGG